MRNNRRFLSKAVLSVTALTTIGAAAPVASVITEAPAHASTITPVVGPSGLAFYTPPSTLPTGNPGSLIQYAPITLNLGSTAPANSANVIMYLSTDQSGNPDVVTGTVILPTAPWTGSGPRPVVDYAFGTQGMAQNCAPSMQMVAGTEYDAAGVIGALQKGYAVVATDYVGYTTGGSPTYIIGQSEGHAVLDAVRAAVQIPNVGITLSNPVITWGFSQGGGASTWAAVLQPTYAPDVNLVGAAAGGVPANLGAVASFSSGSVDSAFVMYALMGFVGAYPSVISESGLFNAQGLAMVKQLSTDGICTINVLSAPFTNVNVNNMINIPLSTLTSTAVAEQSNLGSTPVKVPYFQYTGSQDQMVPVTQQFALKQQFCSEGVTDDYHLYDSDHLLTDLAATTDVLNWMQTILSGGPAPSTCNLTSPLPSSARTTPMDGDLLVPLNNWQLKGGFTIAKRNTPITFPASSSLTGSADLTSQQFTGTATIPPITQTVKLFGLPFTIGLKITPNPLTGTVSLSPNSTLAMNINTTATTELTSLAIGPFKFPLSCSTTQPVSLNFSVNEPAESLADSIFSGSGTTTLPPFGGCGFLGSFINSLFTGPNNPFTITVQPPPAVAY